MRALGDGLLAAVRGTGVTVALRQIDLGGRHSRAELHLDPGRTTVTAALTVGDLTKFGRRTWRTYDGLDQAVADVRQWLLEADEAWERLEAVLVGFDALTGLRGASPGQPVPSAP